MFLLMTGWQAPFTWAGNIWSLKLTHICCWTSCYPEKQFKVREFMQMILQLTYVLSNSDDTKTQYI